jgi:hypothetical protein
LNPRRTQRPETVFETARIWLNHALSGPVRDTTRDSSRGENLMGVLRCRAAAVFGYVGQGETARQLTDDWLYSYIGRKLVPDASFEDLATALANDVDAAVAGARSRRN